MSRVLSYKKIGTLFSSVFILLFLNILPVWVSNQYQTVVQVNHHVKIPDKISKFSRASSKFSTTRKLIQRSRPPMWRTVIGVLPAT